MTGRPHPYECTDTGHRIFGALSSAWRFISCLDLLFSYYPFGLFFMTLSQIYTCLDVFSDTKEKLSEN